MKNRKLLAVVAGTTLAVSPGGNALAQGQGADPQRMGGVMQQFQNMTPEQLENMRQQFQAIREKLQSMDPQQQQEFIRLLQTQRDEWQNMDPQQQQDVFQKFLNTDPEELVKNPQQMLNTIQKSTQDSLRKQMGVTDDQEWLLIEAKIAAVKKARTALSSYGGGFGFGRGGMSGPISPEGQALLKAANSDASTAETEDLLAKFRAARKEKQAALTTAQDELRSVLTLRQEAIATLINLLD